MTVSNTEARKDLDTLVAEFSQTRVSLTVAAESVPTELRERPFVGSWDLKDVIAHTIGWDHTNVEALADFAAGLLPAFFDRYDRDWASINADLITRYRIEDWDTLMRTLRDSGQAFVKALSELNDADLDKSVPWKSRRVSLRGMMRAISHDEAEHVSQIEAFVSQSERSGIQ